MLRCGIQVAASIVEWICERLSDYHRNFAKDTSLMRVRGLLGLSIRFVHIRATGGKAC